MEKYEIASQREEKRNDVGHFGAFHMSRVTRTLSSRKMLIGRGRLSPGPLPLPPFLCCPILFWKGFIDCTPPRYAAIAQQLGR